MKKFEWLLAIILLTSVLSCGKKDNGLDDSENVDMEQPDQLDPGPLFIEKALFNDPAKVKARRKSTVIMDELIYYLDHTPGDADVYISIFKFYYAPLVNAVKAAAERGVNIKVQIDSSEAKSGGSRDANKSTYAQLRYTFSNSDSESRLVGVNNQITASAINHEKYAVFSEVHLPEGNAKNLVFVTSHNFIASATTRANDAVVITNKTLYDTFVRHWTDVAVHADRDMKNFEYTVGHVGDSIDVLFFPRRTGGNWDGGKTIVEQLDGLTDLSKDTICVLMAGWSGVRGMDIARKLTALWNKGATVDVIASSGSSAAVKEELRKLKPPRGRLTTVNFNHSKTVLIKGFWKGEKQTLILTGSKNFYNGGLQYSNNVVLRLKNSVLFKDYLDYFQQMKPIF